MTNIYREVACTPLDPSNNLISIYVIVHNDEDFNDYLLFQFH